MSIGAIAAARPWGRGAAWLLLLAPVFFATYNLANWLASRRDDVGVVVFAWERDIPFVAWTILPYWSIDLLYGLSLFVCATRAELDTHARRLLTAQLGAVTCFILFPLRFSFPRPATTGWSGALFDSLASFDRPFNQAPSLHIALLVILWVLYARHVTQPAARWALHAWFALIGVSVLTTYQHHFFDIPTGAALGLLCLWLWPDRGAATLSRAVPTRARGRRKLASIYGAGALACAALALAAGGAALWLLWVALSLLMVALNYAALGACGFQKDPDGRMSVAALVLLAPYLCGAWINARAWTRRNPAPCLVRDDVWIGRLPARGEAARFGAIIDLCAELPNRSGRMVHAVPMLDLVTPDDADLRRAATLIEAARREAPVLVCCALGFSRSAAAVGAWLLATGRAATAEDAVAQIRRVRHVVLGAPALAAIAAAR